MNAIHHNPKILVVEDNRAMCRVISLFLTNSGYDVTSEFDGESGWNTARQQQFDLIITDHQMPRLSGSELCRRLRETSEYKTTPIFMLTAKSMELDQEHLKTELKVVEVFSKPFSPAEIAKAVEQTLSATI